MEVTFWESHTSQKVITSLTVLFIVQVAIEITCLPLVFTSLIIVSFFKLEIDIGMIFSYHLIDWKFHSIHELRIILNMIVVDLHLLHLLGKH